ncbi:CAP domain-containing protein [Luteolibacter algae]|uniref:CAP domain-containing protein n=2 Tax=Luteolibacter algae TaxID=454151 RepID=A0ABW5D8A9_9BACT
MSAIALAGLLAACSSSPPDVTRVPVSASPTGADKSLRGQIFDEVNQYRTSKGKSSLQRHSGLDAIAQKHCDYLAGNIQSHGLTNRSINHNGFEGRALAARQAYRISTIGENVVTSMDHSSKHLVDLWSRSKSHEHNMRSDWTYTGIGTAVTSQGLVISTQIFGSAETTSHTELSNRFSRVW